MASSGDLTEILDTQNDAEFGTFFLANSMNAAIKCQYNHPQNGDVCTTLLTCIAVRGTVNMMKCVLKDDQINAEDLACAADDAIRLDRAAIFAVLFQDKRFDSTATGGMVWRRALSSSNEMYLGLLLKRSNIPVWELNTMRLLLSAVKQHATPTIVHMLLKDRFIDPNHDGPTSLLVAAVEHGTDEILATLLADTRIDPYAQNSAALNQARVLKKENKIQMLLHAQEKQRGMRLCMQCCGLH